MSLNTIRRTLVLRGLCLLGLAAAPLAPAAGPPGPAVWTDPNAARREDPDFAIQGEYGSDRPGARVGAQVVALGGGQFAAYVLQDGLPGLGWTRAKARTVLTGGRAGDHVTFTGADPQQAATIRGGAFHLVDGTGEKIELPRIERSSPTLGAKPPTGALVLFDGSSVAQWENGRSENGCLQATGCTSTQGFGDYTLHLEFRTPYMPAARGQGRGNSGVYHSGRWETQILDAFGLEGRDNECGGIYSVARPLLNMCLPPLRWQTYDVVFKAAVFDAQGRLTAGRASPCS
jgi:hypothetical protein